MRESRHEAHIVPRDGNGNSPREILSVVEQRFFFSFTNTRSSTFGNIRGEIPPELEQTIIYSSEAMKFKHVNGCPRDFLGHMFYLKED